MSGETDLTRLLQNMRPRLNPGDYVYCVVEDLRKLKGADPVAIFREEEGYTLILPKERADELGFRYSFVAVWITLIVHSALEAVGLTAAFSAALAREGISCNVVAAYFHDHLFVTKEDAEKAMEVLRGLSE